MIPLCSTRPARSKKRNLVASAGDPSTVTATIDPRAHLRMIQLDVLAKFAPLLAGAAVMSCVVLAGILLSRIEPTLLTGWAFSVIASSWLMVRRLEVNALLYVRRDPPRRALVEATLLIGLTAALWAALPVSIFRVQPVDVQDRPGVRHRCDDGWRRSRSRPCLRRRRYGPGCLPPGSDSRSSSAAIASRSPCRC